MVVGWLSLGLVVLATTHIFLNRSARKQKLLDESRDWVNSFSVYDRTALKLTETNRVLETLHQELVKTPAPDKPEEKYGHPLPPISTLSKMLPKFPEKLLNWEITVEHHEESGEPMLVLSLVDTRKTESIIATLRMSLFTVDARCRDSYAGKTWRYRYGSYESTWTTTMKEDLLGPYVDWATQLYYKYEKANDLGEYKFQ